MRHVRPQLWADLDAGRLAAARAAQIEGHAERCERCRAQRRRVLDARRGFAEIAERPAPELAWDHIGARIYWTHSMERRSGEPAAEAPPRRWRWAVAAGGVAVAAIAAALLLWSRDAGAELGLSAMAPPAPPPVPQAITDATPEAMPVELAPAEPLAALLVFARGEVTLGGEPVAWDAPLGEGARLETGPAARAAIQFGAGAGVALGPSSRLELRAFDSQAVELVVAGTVDVVVTRRSRAQQFAVIAGSRSVVVRGTGFRVVHEGGELAVSCEHGRVEVTDGTSSRSLGAGRRLAVADHADLADQSRERALAAGELEALRESLELPLLPAWVGAEAALHTSSVLALEADPAAAVEVDGAPMGRGSLQLRLLPGRHQVAVAGSGEWSNGRWIELEGAATARVHARAARPSGSAGRVRREALARALRGSPGLARCVRRLVKHGVAEGSFASFRAGIGADGAVRFVSVSESNLGLEGRACLLEAVGALDLGPGPAVEIRHRWSY